jgi:nitric oxide reductase NorE protein
MLSQGAGILNTILLLTSSWFVALCVNATRARDFKTASRFLQLGFVLGVAFMVVKAGEWYVKIHAGLPELTHEFFLYYFMFTGLHVTHVALGLVLLVLVWRELRRTQPRAAFVEVGATYWHMVDSLWIVIFALLYLMR